MNPLLLLKQYFGYDYFRDFQEEVIDSILHLQETLVIMPTGGGKSLCFQIPALMLDGLSIVISPLISLMNDQVTYLKRKGIRAEFLNCNQNYDESKSIINNLDNYKIIYVSPERLTNAFFLAKIRKIKISQIVIDEAHCISKWGFDFRKSYLSIKTFIDEIGYQIAITAFTATASLIVQNDIVNILGMKKPIIISSPLDRKKLYYGVVMPKNKLKYLIKCILKNGDKKILIYVLTRKLVEELSAKLKSLGIIALKYHGGMLPLEKIRNQNDFSEGKFKIMIATNAFGMVINIPDIRITILYELPQSLEDLSQQFGRTSRDNQEGKCLLLYDDKDITRVEYFIKMASKEQQKKMLYDLKKVISFANTKRCLHNYLLEHFGNLGENKCNNCSNCLVKNHKTPY